MKNRKLIESAIYKIVRRVINESSDDSEIRQFIRANASQIELELEMDGESELLNTSFPDVDPNQLEVIINDELGI